MDINNIIEKLPKVELHCHLDGSVRPETIFEMLKDQKIALPVKTLEEFERYVKVIGKCESLKEYLTKFKYSIMVMQDKKNIYRITLELLEDCKKQGVKYIEIRFAPYFHLEKGLTMDEVIETVLEAMKAGEERYGVISNLILCAMRHESVDKNIELVNTAKKYINKGVVAIDLAGNEHDFPPELHKRVFDLAKEYGFHITIHAGETGIEQNIIKSIELLHAERIGHGVFAYKNPEIVQFLINNNVPLEVCVTSNYNTEAIEQLKFHPIKSYLEKGIKVTVNTDNETVSNVTLNDEFNILVKELKFNVEDIKKVLFNSIEASFANEGQKALLKNELIKTIKNLNI